MRQVGILPNEAEARRFAAYLATQQISALAEQEAEVWAIWVRDENDIHEARDEFRQFQERPQDARYQGVEQVAATLHREERRRHEQIRKNVHHMRGRWGVAGKQNKPLTVVMIMLSVVVFMISGFGNEKSSVALRKLGFLDFQQPAGWTGVTVHDRLVEIRKGEIWRLITPVFLHLSIMHLVFNMTMLFSFGGILENRRGTVWFGTVALVLAVVSNAVQALVPQEYGGSPFFGGMSGVLYGLFGYLWIRNQFDPLPGVRLPQSSIVIMMVWFFLGAFNVLQNWFGISVANWAHGAGLVAGMAIAYVPIAWRRAGS